MQHEFANYSKIHIFFKFTSRNVKIEFIALERCKITHDNKSKVFYSLNTNMDTFNRRVKMLFPIQHPQWRLGSESPRAYLSPCVSFGNNTMWTIVLWCPGIPNLFPQWFLIQTCHNSMDILMNLTCFSKQGLKQGLLKS